MTDQEFRKKVATMQKQFAKSCAILLKEYLKEIALLTRTADQNALRTLRSRVKRAL